MEEHWDIHMHTFALQHVPANSHDAVCGMVDYMLVGKPNMNQAVGRV